MGDDSGGSPGFWCGICGCVLELVDHGVELQLIVCVFVIVITLLYCGSCALCACFVYLWV